MRAITIVIMSLSEKKVEKKQISRHWIYLPRLFSLCKKEGRIHFQRLCENDWKTPSSHLFKRLNIYHLGWTFLWMCITAEMTSVYVGIKKMHPPPHWLSFGPCSLAMKSSFIACCYTDGALLLTPDRWSSLHCKYTDVGIINTFGIYKKKASSTTASL